MALANSPSSKVARLMILVFGSLNMDLVLRVSAIPRPGETVLAPSYDTVPGGKGNNQAVAAARAGAEVAMAGAVGRDGFGDVLVANLGENGVDATGVARVEAPTGIATIGVDPEGENAIMVASGANQLARAAAVPDDLLGRTTWLVCQMEVPAEETAAMIARARDRGVRSILNLAPAAPIPAETLQALDLLVVNALELQAAAEMLGLGTSDGPLAAARAIAEATGTAVVVTLGGEGALGVTTDGAWRSGVLAVEVVDTTGAGDAFVGALAASLDPARPLPETLPAALRDAGVAAALACTNLGAQSALPDRAAIEAARDALPPPERV